MPDLEELLPGAPYRERHERVVDLPVDRVWASTLAIEARDIRLFGPLMTLRQLPGRALNQSTVERSPAPPESVSFFQQFEEAGFVTLHRDERPVHGVASIVAGAAGKFWRPIGNGLHRLDSLEDFLACTEPGLAKTVFKIEATERDGRTVLETQTRVAGTDRRSTLRFGWYWAVIRGPSGLIRRSMLAAIERRALGGSPDESPDGDRPDI